jgi:hypothetical protein
VAVLGGRKLVFRLLNDGFRGLGKADHRTIHFAKKIAVSVLLASLSLVVLLSPNQALAQALFTTSVGPLTFAETEASSSTPVQGIGGTAPLIYSITPSLPAGLNFNPSTGSVSGIATVTLPATSFTVTVTDATSATSINSFTLTVNPPLTAVQAVASKTLTENHAATPFTPITFTGGSGSPMDFVVSPTLPAGLGMNSSNGQISGLPTATSSAQTFTVTVVDVFGGVSSNSFSLAVDVPVTASRTLASVSLTQNRAVSPVIPVTGGGGTSPLSYSISPSLPTGLSFSTTTGAITGTPMATFAASSFTVTVTDSNSATATNSFNLTVNASVTATQAVSAAALTENHAITAFTPVTGSGGTGALTYSISPSLPGGLNLNTATGAITGTPTAAFAATTLTVTVTDTTGATASNTFSLTVNGPVTATTAVPSTMLVLNHAVTSFTPVTGSGGVGALTFSVSPTLPTGLGFNTSTGAITGTPTVSSPSTTYTVTVTDTNSSTASATFSLSVGFATSTAAIVSSLNPSSFGQPVTFTATINGPGGTPTGTVTFNDGGVAIGTAALSAGVAAFATSALKTGAHTITAVYGGNGSFGPSTSPALTQTVNVPADSLKLRALQVNVTKVVAQGSGQAISGAVDDAIAEGFAEDGPFLARSAAGFHLNFAADPYEEHASSDGNTATPGSPLGSTVNSYGPPNATGNDAMSRQASGRIDDAFAALDRQMPTKAPQKKKFREERNWLFWVDVRGTGFDRITSTTTAAGVTTAAAPLYGFQVNAMMGVTRKITPNVLAGVMAGYEHFNYTEQDINGKLTGEGWTVGSYFGWKITSAIRYEAAVAYSGINYDGVAGTAQGNFNGQRWLVQTGLIGTYKAAGFVFEPSAKVYALWENEGAYTDSLGTLQASHDFSTGRASGGVKVSYPYPCAWSDTVALLPYFGIYGDYYFDQDNAAAIVAAGGIPLASTPLLEGWSARVTGGLGVKFASGGTIGVGAEYGGIGSDFQIWTFKAKADVPF